ncbi:MAG: adenylate/guanylate cyclase domain-containing protein [Sulfurospirillaceae bacterium]|nr:adenylate/guanylate cyclase domain-containing protein [Sulfurospirillaceae bacterium]MDD2825423.1 adenylate/guanylate cyclase domain-containing protein [Sulfurospirillaceae bacterium]
MKIFETNQPFIVNFFNELALYSGQYALFYLFMQFSAQEPFWGNAGHVLLLLTLIVQTTALVYFGEKIMSRIAFSFLTVVVYSAFEFQEGGLHSLLNIGHLFFWLSTALLVALQYIGYISKRQNTRFLIEFLVSNINIFIFIFIYFFFDLKLKLQEELALGKITEAYADAEILIGRLLDGFSEFLDDPAHVYIIIGGLFLSLTIAYSRIKILVLSEKIDGLLVRYIGEETRNKLVQKGSESNSMRLNMVLLYSDIRNFTVLSEKSDASKVVGMLNFYYGIWHETVKAHHGIINKFIGDALLAFFDKKDVLNENARFAVMSALEMLEKFEQINHGLQDKNLPMMEGIGIGIHCGEVILGDIGGERKDYTLIGDTVNTTARLEALCKECHTPLIVSEACYLLLDEPLKVRFSYIASLSLKGKEEKIACYGLIP